MRPSAIALLKCSRAFSATEAIIAVSIAPGATALTRNSSAWRTHGEYEHAHLPAALHARLGGGVVRLTMRPHLGRQDANANDRTTIAHDLQAILATMEDTASG